MRVAHNMLYESYISQLNKSTSRLQELSEQAATQKKVNRPSDNPVGTARILNYRDSISALQQFQDNISQAKSRLGLTDDTLQQTQDMLSRSKELAVQAANDTLTPENRESIAQELQQIFDQVLAQSNTKYEGRNLFAGHKVQDQAYARGLAVSSNETRENSQGQEMDKVVPYVKEIKGESRDPIRVEFLTDQDMESAVIGE
ncbi:MAG: flagellar hook-associated protein FlgL, partial [Desulfohalobiaceae bacterium]